MTKPDDVTQEAWDESLQVFDAYLYNGESAQEIIARAIMAAEKRGGEREREAIVVWSMGESAKYEKLAKSYSAEDPYGFASNKCLTLSTTFAMVSDDIRNRGEAK